MIIGDHVIFVFAGHWITRCLQLVLVWLEMCPGHLCPCQHLHPCGEGVVHTLVLPCWCSRIFVWHATYYNNVDDHCTPCSCPGVRWWSVLVTRRLSHVLILVSYYHHVASAVWPSDLLSPDLGHGWWCASASTSTTAEETDLYTLTETT